MKKYSEDEIMESLEGLKRAESPPFLRTRVFVALRIDGGKSTWKWVPAMATFILLGLLISNIMLYNMAKQISTEQSNQTQQFSQTYPLPLTPTLYEQDIK